MAKAIQLKVIGEATMYCAGCEQRVGTVLRRMPGVESVSASAATQQINVNIDPHLVEVEQLQARLEHAGYATTVIGSDA